MNGRKIKHKICLALTILLTAGITLCNPRFKSSGPVAIYYEQSAMVELINSRGTRVLIDVNDPDVLSSPPTKKDVLLTTHTHGDHYKYYFARSFPGPQLTKKIGEIKLEDAYIRSIASAHNEEDKMIPENGSNYIFIIDMGGLRIVHFGDIGQKALTSEQLDALGKVDIAIINLSAIYANMNSQNRKAFNLIDQLNPRPRLIIPAHIHEDVCAKIAADKWIAYNTNKRSTTINVDKLPDKTTIVFMGKNAKLLKLPISDL